MSQINAFGATLQFEWPTKPDIRDTRGMNLYVTYLDKLIKMSSGELPYLEPEYVHMKDLYESGSSEWKVLRDRLVTRDLDAWTLEEDTGTIHQESLDEDFWRSPAAVPVMEHGVCIRTLIGSFDVHKSIVWVVLKARDVVPTAETPPQTEGSLAQLSERNTEIVEAARELCANRRNPYIRDDSTPNYSQISNRVSKGGKYGIQASAIEKILRNNKHLWLPGTG